MRQKWHILFCDEMEQACPVTDFINPCQYLGFNDPELFKHCRRLNPLS